MVGHMHAYVLWFIQYYYALFQPLLQQIQAPLQQKNC